MFEVEQTYDLAALTVLCRALRKTGRPVWRVVRGVIWGIFALGAALIVYSLATGNLSAGDWKLLLSVAVLLGFLVFEDRLNGWIALRQLVPGTAHSTTVFEEDAYTVTTEKTQTRWQYDNITSICESERYYLCFLGKKHGQLFDKRCFRQDNSDAFRAFLEQKTGKTFQKVK